jgi:hypothetical protein
MLRYTIKKHSLKNLVKKPHFQINENAAFLIGIPIIFLQMI